MLSLRHPETEAEILARRLSTYPNRSPEQEAKVQQLVGELREAQAIATAALNRTIDVTVELWALQGASQEDINVLRDRKARSIYFVDMLSRITDMDRLRKWAGLSVR